MTRFSKRFSVRWCLPAGLALALIWSGHLVGQVAGTPQTEGGSRLDRARELVMKIDAPFTVAAVGDVFGAMAPITPLAEPRLQACSR